MINVMNVEEAVNKFEGMNKEIFEAWKEKGYILNDHKAPVSNGIFECDARPGYKMKNVYLMVLKNMSQNGETYVALGMIDDLFCLNSVYAKDGQAHLSTISVGGTIEQRVSEKEDIIRVLENYNLTHEYTQITDVIFK